MRFSCHTSHHLSCPSRTQHCWWGPRWRPACTDKEWLGVHQVTPLRAWGTSTARGRSWSCPSSTTPPTTRPPRMATPWTGYDSRGEAAGCAVGAARGVLYMGDRWTDRSTNATVHSGGREQACWQQGGASSAHPCASRFCRTRPALCRAAAWLIW